MGRGAPLGNRNGANHHEFREGLRYALAQEYPGKAERGTALRRIAIRLVEAALDGHSFAIQEVANRLDGKPTQAIEMSGGGNLVDLIAALSQARAATPAVDNPNPTVEQPVTH